jgi:hypothetical protein
MTFERFRLEPNAEGEWHILGLPFPIVGFEEVWIERRWLVDYIDESWFARKADGTKVYLRRMVQPRYGMPAPRHQKEPR